MTRMPILLAATLLSLASAGRALAQQAGTYSGTAADGSSISFVIGTDSATGKLQVTSANIAFADTCNPGAFTLNSGWGLGGDGTDLRGASGTYTYSFSYFYVTATLKFSGTTLSGTILNATPTLVEPLSGNGEPKKAAYCASKKQAFNATLQPAASGVSPDFAGHAPAGMAYGATIKRD